MTDYTYVECTSACIQALKHFTDHNSHRQEDIRSVCLLCSAVQIQIIVITCCGAGTV